MTLLTPPRAPQILEHTPEGHADRGPLREALERAEELCSQVNEGVREKENSDRLEWIQSHIHFEGAIEVQSHFFTYTMPAPGWTPFFPSELPSFFKFNKVLQTFSSPPHSKLYSLPPPPPSLFQHLVFNSLTNCLGPRKLLHSGRLHKTKSSRELWAFLFNDFLLLTHSAKPFSSSGQDKLFSLKTNIQLKMYKTVGERRLPHT